MSSDWPGQRRFRFDGAHPPPQSLDFSGGAPALGDASTGHKPEAPLMLLTRDAMLAAGAAECVNSFTLYYLALLGIISYAHCPAVPPEIILLPSWAPFNVYEMSAWSRTIVIPRSLLWAF